MPSSQTWLALALCAAVTPAFAQDPIPLGLEDVVDVVDLPVTAADHAARQRILDASPWLSGPGRSRRVRCVARDEDGLHVAVTGVLHALSDSFTIEHYQAADLSEALRVATIGRAQPAGRRVLEIRDRHLVLMSGSGALGSTFPNAARAPLWSGLPTRVDVLGVQASADHAYYLFSGEAVTQSAPLAELLAQQRGMVHQMAQVDTTSVLSQDGDLERLTMDDTVVVIGPHTLGVAENEGHERHLRDYLRGVALNGPTPTAGAGGATGGATGVVGALTGGSGSPSAPALPAELGPAHHGQRFRARVGELIQLVLPGNMTTGFQWLPRAAPVHLRQVGSSYAPAATATGAGGGFVLAFRAERVGTELLVLDYRRPWQSAGADRFEVTIEVE